MRFRGLRLKVETRCCPVHGVLGTVVEGGPLKGTLLNPTSGSLKRDLVERVYIPDGPPNPNSCRSTELCRLTHRHEVQGQPFDGRSRSESEPEL